MSLSRRIFWHVVGSFHMVFAPLCGIALVVGVILWPEQLAEFVGFLMVLVACALAAASFAAARIAREMATSLENVEKTLAAMASGDFLSRASLEHRHLVEPIADTCDTLGRETRRRLASLEDNRDVLRTVLNAMLEGVVALDDALRILVINDAACRHFSLHEGTVMGRPLWEVIRHPSLQTLATQALAEGRIVDSELELHAPLSRMLKIRVAPVKSAKRRGVVLVAEDISQLRHLEQVRREFVANASHELKTPLASIKACLETLIDGAVDDVDYRMNFLQTASDQADRLDDLVKDLLALTRIESAEMPFELREIDVSIVARRCFDRHSQRAEKKSIDLTMRPSSDPLILIADEEALEQILDNLLDNAIKYTNTGGRVFLWWELSDKCGRIGVEDTGIGIPQNQITRIFERFYRVDKARSRALGGTGLGLSIVKHLCQMLSGTVDVVSQVDTGTTFIVTIPRASGGSRLKLAIPGREEAQTVEQKSR